MHFEFGEHGFAADARKAHDRVAARERIRRKSRVSRGCARGRLDGSKRAFDAEAHGRRLGLAVPEDASCLIGKARAAARSAAVDPDEQAPGRYFHGPLIIMGEPPERLPMRLPDDNEITAVCAERIFDGRDWHKDAAVVLAGPRIRDVVAASDIPSGCAVEPLPEGAILAPGFIDLQVNGGGGVLLNDDPSPQAMQTIARAHRRLGTTALLPTLISDTRDHARAAIASARAIAGRDGVLGLHLEGPFLNPARAGVHDRARIAVAMTADLEWLRALGEAGRSMITLAPECVPEGFIRGLVEAGIRVAAGHSEASAEIVLRAIGEGLSGVTHLFNAMPPFQGRAPGLVGTALAERGLVAGLIVDGFHVDPVSVRAAFSAKTGEGIALVTDAMPTLGSGTTEFELTGRKIFLRGGRLVTAEGTLAGAHLDLASAVRNAVTHCGIPLAEALRAATLTPAKFLGLDHERGALIPDARADLVALDEKLRVVACWMDGRHTESA
jgi:N-acetylglucosamine-6-phosphate deacetylase